MSYRVWYSTESFADYIIANTMLTDRLSVKKELIVSDAQNSFHLMPDHIKQILYLDAPDLIVEFNNEPMFTIEESKEAPTGHNPFQRFPRLVASVEHNVPAFYIFTEGKLIKRQNQPPKWDVLNNPLIFRALEMVMLIHKIPALFYYFPSDFREYRENPSDSPNLADKGLKLDAEFISCPDGTNPEMQLMFQAINEIIAVVEEHGVIEARELLFENPVLDTRVNFMRQEFIDKGENENGSPVTATETIPTAYLLNYLSSHESPIYQIGELLRSREETVIYKMDSELRSDPYTGAFVGIDYLKCRNEHGRTFEDRNRNLVLCVGQLEVNHEEETLQITNNPNTTNSTISDFINDVKRSEERRNILTKDFGQLRTEQIPRYYMQARYGSMFSKAKHIRIFSYFADAILFPDGSLWRDA